MQQTTRSQKREHPSFFEKGFVFIYHQLYYLGLQAGRYLRRTIHFVGGGVLFLLRYLLVFYRIVTVALNRYGLRTLRMFREELGYLREEVRRARHKLKAHESRAAIKEFFRYVGKGVRRHKRMLRDLLLGVCLPVASVACLLLSVSYWSQLTIALQVDYKGKTLGYITDETVFNKAVQIAQGRIVGGAASGALPTTPAYTIRPVKANLLMNAGTLSDKLLDTTGGQVENACGVYIDGTFAFAVKNETDVVSLLDSYLQKESTGKAGERVEFLQDISRVQGMYSTEYIWDVNRIWDKFNSTSDEPMEYQIQTGDTLESICSKFKISMAVLQSMNPNMNDTIYAGARLRVPSNQKFLQVQVTRTELFNEKIPFDTVEVKNASRYQGYRQVKVNGEEGLRQITAMVTYVDGVETERNEINRVTVKEPVTKKVEIGTKSTSAAGLGGSYSVTPTAGRFVWPVVGLRNVTSPFGYRWGRHHNALDISGSGAHGRLILAADGGVVEYAGYHYSYGNYVIIDHGGGVKTLYAHASYLGVSTGQRVSQGEAIARVGNTGNSFGAHLHFGVMINGNFVDPSPYLGL